MHYHEKQEYNLVRSAEDGRNISRFNEGRKSLSSRLIADGLYILLLLVINGLYLYIGGLVFYSLESKAMVALNMEHYIANFVDTLKATSVGPKLLQPNTSSLPLISSLSKKDLFSLKHNLELMNPEMVSNIAYSWTLPNSVFFASTIVTTIGLGHLTLATDGGRAFCVLYALFGIPLTFHSLAVIGRVLASYMNESYGFIVKKCRKCCRKEESSFEDIDSRPPIWLACCSLLLYLICCTAVIMCIERWNLSISIYYIFIVLTTIGLGDIVPRNEDAVWFHVVFIYVGLAAVSTTLNLILSNIKMHVVGKKFGFGIFRSNKKDADSDMELDLDGKEQAFSNR